MADIRCRACRADQSGAQPARGKHLQLDGKPLVNNERSKLENELPDSGNFWMGTRKSIEEVIKPLERESRQVSGETALEWPRHPPAPRPGSGQ